MNMIPISKYMLILSQFFITKKRKQLMIAESKYDIIIKLNFVKELSPNERNTETISTI